MIVSGLLSHLEKTAWRDHRVRVSKVTKATMPVTHLLPEKATSESAHLYALGEFDASALFGFCFWSPVEYVRQLCHTHPLEHILAALIHQLNEEHLVGARTAPERLHTPDTSSQLGCKHCCGTVGPTRKMAQQGCCMHAKVTCCDRLRLGLSRKLQE